MTKDFKDTFIGKLTKPNGEIDFDTWEGLSYETKKAALKELQEWFTERDKPKEPETFHLSEPEGFISLSHLYSLMNQVMQEHPYRVQGDFDTYTDYNMGWQDALVRLDSMLPTYNVLPKTK